MQTEKFTVKNVKCGGCAARIKQALEPLECVESVEVDVAEGSVSISGSDLPLVDIKTTLGELGYPVV